MSKVVIVTGAGKGIGAGSAIRLSTAGYSAVVLVARTESSLKAVAAEIEKTPGAKALVIAADLTKPETPKLVVERTIQEFGRIDAVFNNAGAVKAAHILTLTDADWEDGLNLKLHGARRLTVLAWPHLKKVQGQVLFMSGVATESPNRITGATSATNAAVVALSKAFADLGLEDDVQVNTILPGPIETERLRTSVLANASSQGVSLEEAKQQYLKKSGIKRIGTVEEVAELVAYLLSPAAKFVTGSQFRIDGGVSKNP